MATDWRRSFGFIDWLAYSGKHSGVMLLLFAFWVVFTGLFAFGQGWIMPAIRRTPKGTEATRQSIALHWIFGAVWVLPLVFTLTWLAVAIALIVRVALFDICLNYAAGDALFNVGQEANTDKLQHWLAGKLGVQVSVLAAILRLLGIGVFVAIMLINS